MREIKFRAWDNVRGKMIDHVAVFGTRHGSQSVLLPHGELGNRTDYALGDNWRRDDFGNTYSADNSVIAMQYTGLKDKNGVEIYEGDLVEATDVEVHRHWPERKAVREKSKKSRFRVSFDSKGVHFNGDYSLGSEYYPHGYIKNFWFYDETPLHATGELICGDTWNHDFSELTDFEVIGNIYENAELLKEQTND